jgi:hypothetical protein
MNRQIEIVFVRNGGCRFDGWVDKRKRIDGAGKAIDPKMKMGRRIPCITCIAYQSDGIS